MGSNMSSFAKSSKVNLDLWNLFIAIVTLDLTYKVRIMTLASAVFKISTFQKKNAHFNVFGATLTLTLGRSRSI